MKQKIVGIHVHHSVFLEDAVRGAANARAGLTSAIGRTGDNDLIDLAWRYEALLGEIVDARNAAAQRLRDMPAAEVVECREGRQPWPDELAEGFEPRCTCFDRCGVHDFGRDPAEAAEAGWICNCGPCPAHG